MVKKDTKDLQLENKILEEEKVKDLKVTTKRKTTTSKSLKKEDVKKSIDEKPKRKTTKKTKSSEDKINTTEKEPKKTSTSKSSEKKVAKTIKKTESSTTKPKKVSKSKSSEEKVAKTAKKANKPEVSATKVKKTSSSKSSDKKVTKTTKSKKTSSNTKKKNNKKLIKSARTISLANQSLRKNIEILQYFELPYRYNETTVKILAQTPKTLFVYWDIADHDIEQYKLNYGENFFNDTYPILLVKNETYGYIEEIPINDFANSWYLQIKDSYSKYSIELGRKYKNKPTFESSYIYVKDSNEIVVPNNKILIDKLKPSVKYRNAKTNEVTYKNINNIIKDGQIIDFYNLYQYIYNIENVNEFSNFLNNPSSGNPTSSFK